MATNGPNRTLNRATMTISRASTPAKWHQNHGGVYDEGMQGQAVDRLR